MNRILFVAGMSIAFNLSSLLAQSPPGTLTKHVFAAESSFAASMARRDHKAFAALVSPEAVFFSDTEALRGKEAVVKAWRNSSWNRRPPSRGGRRRSRFCPPEHSPSPADPCMTLPAS